MRLVCKSDEAFGSRLLLRQQKDARTQQGCNLRLFFARSLKASINNKIVLELLQLSKVLFTYNLKFWNT